MTNEEARKAVATVAAYFPSRLSPEAVRAWAVELERFELVDAIAGVREHARTSVHPNLRDLLVCCRDAREDRRQRERVDRPALPAYAPRDDASIARGTVARGVAVDMALGFLPLEVFEAEVQSRLGMSPVDIADRRAALKRQSVRNGDISDQSLVAAEEA